MSESVKPPWRGEYTFRQLSTYPNTRVQAVIRHLSQAPFRYIPDDMMTGQMISRLCDFVDGSERTRYDTSRIREGNNGRLNVPQQAQGVFFVPARQWALLDAFGPGRLTLDLGPTGGPHVR